MSYTQEQLIEIFRTDVGGYGAACDYLNTQVPKDILISPGTVGHHMAVYFVPEEMTFAYFSQSLPFPSFVYLTKEEAHAKALVLGPNKAAEEFYKNSTSPTPAKEKK